MRGSGIYVLGALACALACLWAPASATAGKGGPAPNIVLITTDDQPLSTFERSSMPRTFRHLVDRGTSFSDAVVNVPLCCPSRATLLTGQYPHNHRVLTNDPGYPKLREHRNVLPVWLRRAGYRTGHFGKWLHGYESARGARPAPGWSSWLTQMEVRRYYDYKLSRDGKVVRKGSRPRHHLTEVVTRAASRFVNRNAKRRRPLFLQLDYYAPHSGPRYSDGVRSSRCVGAPEPSPRDRRTILEGGAPRTPAFDEKDISDKPDFFRFGEITGEELDRLDRRYRCTLESLAGVDRGIARIVRKFRDAGELRDTALVFLTDNGYFFGEHRVRDGKARPWEEAIRTPLVLRLPRERRQGVDEVGEQVAEIDVVPTLLDLAGADPCRRERRCRVLDGRSLLRAARGRTGYLRDRAVLVEMDDRVNQPRSFACRFRALRTSGDVLIENLSVPDLETRICEDRLLFEHYALDEDPFQLDNRASPDGALRTPGQRELARRLSRLRDCSGIRGRDRRSPGGFCE